MAYNAGITLYQKKKWMDEIVANAANLRLVILGDGTTRSTACSTADALQDPTDNTTALDYADISAQELSGTGTGYNNTGVAATTGFAMSGLSIATGTSGNGYTITFTTATTGSGTITGGDEYAGAIVDTADSNRILAVMSVNITTGSSDGTMDFDLATYAMAVI